MRIAKLNRAAHAAAPKSAAAALERLEDRTLFAATAVLTAGVLTITGTSGKDDIYVAYQGSTGSVTVAQRVNGRYQKTHSFPKSAVKSVKATLGDGDDGFFLDGNVGVVPATVDGGNGADFITGGNGNDTLIGGAGNDNFNGGVGDDKIDGGAGNDSLGGSFGNDTLLGGDGNDALSGGHGDDIMDGGLGADRMDGYLGIDTVTYASRTAPIIADITEAPGELADDGQAGEKDFIVASVENLIGGSGNDKLTGTFYGYKNKPLGLSFDNKLDGGAGNDTLLGLDGNDTLRGGIGNDTIRGGDGNDTLFGDKGIDKLYGDAGNDVLWIKSSPADADTADGGAGTDKAQKDNLDGVLNIESFIA